jgi:hypothetical protein
VVIELDEQKLAALDSTVREAIRDEVGSLFRDGGFAYPVAFAAYRTGGAFLVRLHRDAA